MTTTTLRRGTGLVAALALASTALTSCGDDVPAYDPAVARQLQVDVDEVRAAAEQRDADEALAAINLLTRHVADAQASGQLPGDKARAILRAADLVVADIQALPTPTPTPTATPKPTTRKPKAKATKKPSQTRKQTRQGTDEPERKRKGDKRRSRHGEHD